MCSPPSKMLADLEQKWGMTLLERSKSGVCLTSAGEPVRPFLLLEHGGKTEVSDLLERAHVQPDVRFTTWEDFARKLDEVLAQFVAIYHPAYFERIGLRYINGFSRRALGLEGVPFRDLIQPAYLGLMAEDDVQEQSVQRVTQDVEMALAGGCRLKLHCGPGMVKRGNVEDKEVRFILDNDVFMNGKIELKHSAGALNTVHTHADRIFRGAITDQLHDAMEPQPL